MITIKELTPAYIDQILELEKHSAPKLPTYYPYDEEELNNMYKNGYHKLFGAFDKDKLVGWAAYRTSKDKKGEYEMSALVVDKQYRRKGVGQLLFNTRLDEIKSKPDFKKVYATNYPKNTPIIMLYLKNGFVISDYKKDVYGPGGDRVYMVLEK